MLIFQRKLNLAGFYELTGEPAGPLEFKLQPAGTVVGRLVDGHGKPLPDVTMVISSRTGSTKNSGAENDTNTLDEKQISTDKQGLAVRGRHFRAVVFGRSHRLDRGQPTSQAAARRDLQRRDG